MNLDDTEKLKELIEFLKQNEVGEFALESGDLKVQLKFASAVKGGLELDSATRARLLAGPALAQAAPLLPGHPAAPSLEAPTAAAVAAAAAADEEAALHTVKSPIVGTFYESPAPGAAAFVKPGDQIEVGQPLCIIEAMKLMNEIESDITGEVVRRLVQNGQPVEFGQPLFAVRPR